MSLRQHRHEAVSSVPVSIITVSDTRTSRTDQSGRLIRQMLEKAGHRVLDHRIVPDQVARIRRALESCLKNRECRVVVLTGGTGASKRDRTPEAVKPYFDKPLDGFGEIFRMLSFRQVGAAAFLSRACAGIRGDRVIFALPGAEKAVSLAMEKLILPELGHLGGELKKQSSL